MKRLFALFAFCLLGLTGCQEGKPLESKQTANGWKVDFCFEKDGYKIYRFWTDDGYKYYVVPHGGILEENRRRNND